MRWQFAQFCENQFSTQSMANYWPRPYFPMPDDTAKSGTYALHTLSESETITRLATGIERIPLPDEYNFIKVYQELSKGSYRNASLSKLAQIFLNRRQYPKSASYFRQLIAAQPNNSQAKRQLEQIVNELGPTGTDSNSAGGHGRYAELSLP